MVNEPINLNRVRKNRARADRKVQANANAASFGRTKAQKILDEARRKKDDQALDGHKKEDKEPS